MSFVRLSSAITIALVILHCISWIHFAFDPRPMVEYAGLAILGGGFAILIAFAMHRALTIGRPRALRLSLVLVAAATAYALLHIQVILVHTRNVLPGDLDGFILMLVPAVGSVASVALSIDVVCNAIDIHSNPKLRRVSQQWIIGSRILGLVWPLSFISTAFLTLYFYWLAYVPFACFALFVHRRIYRELREMHDSVIAAINGAA